MAGKSRSSNSLLDAVTRAAVPNQASTGSNTSEEVLTVAEKSKPIKTTIARASGREGTRLIAGHFDPAVARQLKLLAAEEDTTVQALLAEALDLLFVKKGKGRLAALSKLAGTGR